MTIKKLVSTSTGKPFYRVRLQVDGKRHSKNFERKTDAILWETSLRSNASKVSVPTQSPLGIQTVADAIVRYIETYLVHRPRTHLDRGYQLDWWKKEIGAIRLSDLDSTDIQQCFTKLGLRRSRSRKPISGATINRYRAALSHVLVKANRWRWIDENPLQQLDKYPEPKGRDKCLTLDEIDRLREACRSSKSIWLELIFLIAICTGMRKAEILGLTYSQLDIHRRYIRLTKTKNGEPRSIPISDALIKHLTKLEHGPNDQLLFPSPTNPLKPICIKGAYSRAVANAGITSYTFHDNRHTAASYMAKNGTSLLLLAEIFGWKSLEMAKRYAYLQPSAGVESINIMNAEIVRDQ